MKKEEFTPRSVLEESVAFQEWFCKRADDIDNAALDFLCVLAQEDLERDINLIAELTDFAESLLKEADVYGGEPYHVCRPFFTDNGEGEVICFENPESRAECPWCKRTKGEFR